MVLKILDSKELCCQLSKIHNTETPEKPYKNLKQKQTNKKRINPSPNKPHIFLFVRMVVDVAE